jgi:hypothetical protein
VWVPASQNQAQNSPELSVASPPGVRLTHRIGFQQEDFMRVSRTLVVVLCLVLAIPVFAASNKSEGTAATVTLDGFDPEAATFGVSNVVSDTTGGGVGKVTFSDFVFSKRLDAQSSKLFKSCTTGAHFKSATIVVRDAKGNTSNDRADVREDRIQLLGNLALPALDRPSSPGAARAGHT